MELTRITKENAAYFEHLLPDDLMKEEDKVKLGVLSEGKAVSACAVAVRDGMADLRWLYTDPESRGQGCASFLLEELFRLLEGSGITGIEADFRSEDEELEDFLMERGFLVGEESALYRVPIMELLYGSRMEEMISLRSREMMTCSLREPKILKPLAHFLRAHKTEPVFAEGISREYSFVTMDSRGEVIDVILISEEGKDLHINYLIGEGSTQGMVSLVAAVYDRIKENGKEDGDLIFSDRSWAALPFIEKITGNDEDQYRVPGLMYAVKLFGQAVSA